MHIMYKCKFYCTVSKRTLYEHENFMNIVETITKNMIIHVSCLKMSFENTKLCLGKILKNIRNLHENSLKLLVALIHKNM